MAALQRLENFLKYHDFNVIFFYLMGSMIHLLEMFFQADARLNLLKEFVQCISCITLINKAIVMIRIRALSVVLVNKLLEQLFF